MTVLVFIAFLALAVLTGARVGFRAARAFQAKSAQIEADAAFMRSIPSDMDWEE